MNPIDCDEHGPSAACLICRHLREGAGLGYFAIAAEPGESAQAWCEACDQTLAQERGWTDKASAQADWALYCTQCHDETLASHVLRSWVEGTSPEE